MKNVAVFSVDNYEYRKYTHFHPLQESERHVRISKHEDFRGYEFSSMVLLPSGRSLFKQIGFSVTSRIK